MSNRQITHLWGEGFYGERETSEVLVAVTMSSKPAVMYVTDRIDSYGSSVLTGTPTMTVEGGREVLGSATLASVSYTLGEGETIKTGGSTFYANSTLTATGYAEAFGATSMTTTGTVTPEGTRVRYGTAALTQGESTMVIASVFQVAEDTVMFTEDAYDIFRFNWEDTSV